MIAFRHKLNKLNLSITVYLSIICAYLQVGCNGVAPAPDVIDILVIGDSALSTLVTSDTNGLARKTVFPGLEIQNLENNSFGTHKDILDRLVESENFYVSFNAPRMVLLDIGNENAQLAANKDPANHYLNFFSGLQDDLAEGSQSGVGIEDIVIQIQAMWPETHIMIVNPLPALQNYEERVLVNNWTTFNAKAQALAVSSKISFVDLNAVISDVFYDKSSKTFKHLADLDAGLSVSQWESWTQENEYALFASLFSSTHDSAFGLNFLGRLLTAKFLECPITAILTDGNDNFQCPVIDLVELNALRLSIVERDIMIFGDSVLAGVLGNAWQATFPEFVAKKMNVSGQRHFELMEQFEANEALFSAIYDPKVVLINIGTNDKAGTFGDTEENIFISTQNDVAHGDFSGVGINDINSQILEIWPDTSIVWMTPQARSNSFEKRVRLMEWTIFNTEAMVLAAASDQVFFINSHYAFTEMFYDATNQAFYWLGDVEPSLSVDSLLGWTEADEYATYFSHWETTHTDMVHLTKYGYMIFIKLLECPLRALIDDNNPNYICNDIVPADIDALRLLIP